MAIHGVRRLTAVLTAVVVGATAGAFPAAAQTAGEGDSISSGGTPRGDANGQVVTVAPVAGELALPVKLITSGARVEDEVTRGSSATVDAGLLGSLATLALTNTPTLAQLGIDTAPFRSFQLPGVTVADSRTTTEARDNPVIPNLDFEVVEIGGGSQYASATPKGEGKGRTEGGSFRVDLGPIEVALSGLVSESIAGQQRSIATTSLGEMKISGFGIPFVARGLEWMVSQEIEQPAVASFAVGSVEFGPTRIAAPSIEQLADIFARFNTAIAPSGFKIELPTATVSEAGGKISPLHIGLRNSQAAAATLGPIYELLLADIVNQLEGALVGGLPETGLAVTVANVVIAAAVGRGGASVELGGGDARLIRTPIETYDYESIGGQEEFDGSGLGDTSFDAGGTSDFSGDSSFTDSSSFDSGSGFGAGTDVTSLPEPTAGEEVAAGDAAFGGQPASFEPFGRVLEDEQVPAWLLVLAGIGLTMAMWASDRTRIRRLLEVSR